MTHQICTVLCGGAGPILPEGPLAPVSVVRNSNNSVSPCEAYQLLLNWHKSDIIVYLHDDLTIHDPDWLPRLLEPFSRPDVVAVGFGGATALGNWDLLRKPYRLQNMARGGYISNQTDAEVHGERVTGVHRVAVLDAFCIAVRSKWLRSVGGWPVNHLTFHCLDLWLGCQAARWNKETFMVGISVTHHGGGSSTKSVYQSAKWLIGGSQASDHSEPHKWLLDQFRDVLPLQVQMLGHSRW